MPGIGQLSGMDTQATAPSRAVHFTLPGGTNDRANWDVVGTVRSQTVPAAFGSLPDVKVWVSGDAALAKDQTEMFAGQTPMVMAFVLGLSFLLLLVVFHSIVIPIGAILLTLLSAGAAFGVLQLVFQEGWLKDQLDVTPSPLESWLPAMVFTILFGLSMDYQVFILTRVKEARDRGLSSVDAVVKGVSVDGRHGDERGRHHGRGLRCLRVAALRDHPPDGPGAGRGHRWSTPRSCAACCCRR